MRTDENGRGLIGSLAGKGMAGSENGRTRSGGGGNWATEVWPDELGASASAVARGFATGFRRRFSFRALERISWIQLRALR